MGGIAGRCGQRGTGVARKVRAGGSGRGADVGCGGGDRTELLLNTSRRLRPGRYTLTIQPPRGRHTASHRSTIVVR